jgi:hypothetical protein
MAPPPRPRQPVCLAPAVGAVPVSRNGRISIHYRIQLYCEVSRTAQAHKLLSFTIHHIGKCLNEICM